MNRQRGIILISVLVLVALAAVVATALFFETAMSARRSAASFGMEQALQLGQGAEALSAYALGQDKNQTDTPAEEWAQPYGPVDVEQGITLEAKLGDEQAKFNINALLKDDGKRNDDAYKVFQRLLELCGLEVRWADMIVDWIDPDNVPGTGGAEDNLYMSLTPPHLTSNQMLTSISELRQIPGFTAEMYTKLAPHVTALPHSVNRINICTADGVVLDALYALHPDRTGYIEHSQRPQADMDKLRASGCFPSRVQMIDGAPKIGELIAERSSYFRLQTWIHIGTAEFALYSLMYRDGRGQARAVARSFGTE